MSRHIQGPGRLTRARNLASLRAQAGVSRRRSAIARASGSVRQNGSVGQRARCALSPTENDSSRRWHANGRTPSNWRLETCPHIYAKGGFDNRIRWRLFGAAVPSSTIAAPSTDLVKYYATACVSGGVRRCDTRVARSCRRSSSVHRHIPPLRGGLPLQGSHA